MTTPTPSPLPDPAAGAPAGSVPGAAGPAGAAPSGPTPPPSRGRGIVGITVSAAIVGGLAIAVAGTTAAVAATNQYAAVASSGVVTGSSTVGTAGVDRIALETGAARTTIRYDDVSQASLTIEGDRRGDWEFRRDGNTLVVNSPRAWWGWWLTGWVVGDTKATLVLPKGLEGRIDADLTVSSGSLNAEGGFRDLRLDLSAGEMTVSATARTVRSEVSAGDARVSIANATTVDLSMSAGKYDAELTGRQPDTIKLGVSAGSMRVTVPKGSYAVSRDVSAGSIDNGLNTDAASTHRIAASVSAGSITLRPGN